MIVTITEPVTLDGQHFSPGVTADVAEEIGQLWIDAGVARAETVNEPKPKAKARAKE